MGTNPYQPPQEASTAPPGNSTRQGAGIVQHAVALAVLAFVSLVVAMLVTPADPFSMLLAVVPIFLVVLAAYWWGTRNGNRRA